MGCATDVARHPAHDCGTSSRCSTCFGNLLGACMSSLADDVRRLIRDDFQTCLEECEIHITQAGDDDEAHERCKLSHAKVARTFCDLAERHSAQPWLLGKLLAETWQGMDLAVPLPPLPKETPASVSEAPAAAPAAQPEAPEQSLDFEWYFLQCGANVWSVLKAWKSHASLLSCKLLVACQVERLEVFQGYEHLFTFAETWAFKTNFTSWFSKSWATVAKPLLEAWGFAEFHVSYLLKVAAVGHLFNVGLRFSGLGCASLHLQGRCGRSTGARPSCGRSLHARFVGLFGLLPHKSRPYSRSCICGLASPRATRPPLHL